MNKSTELAVGIGLAAVAAMYLFSRQKNATSTPNVNVSPAPSSTSSATTSTTPTASTTSTTSSAGLKFTTSQRPVNGDPGWIVNGTWYANINLIPSNLHASAQPLINTPYAQQFGVTY